MTETVQLCPISDCFWINPIVETDEPSVFSAAMKTFEHLMEQHKTLDGSIWREIVLCRVPRRDVVDRVAR